RVGAVTSARGWRSLNDTPPCRSMESPCASPTPWGRRSASNSNSPATGPPQPPGIASGPVPKGATMAAIPFNVLVADANDADRTQLRALLAQLGHTVVGEAGSGLAMVLDVLRTGVAIDLIVFETALNELDGLVALNRVYEEQVIPAVVVTANRDRATVERAA